MGWNSISELKTPLFDHISEEEYFYFVHSYYATTGDGIITAMQWGFGWYWPADAGAPYQLSAKLDNIAVTDSRKPGGCLELVGTYDNQHKPVILNLQEDKIGVWLAKGAVPTPTVKKLFMSKGIFKKKIEPAKAGA